MIRFLFKHPFSVAAIVSAAFIVFQATNCSSPLTTEDVIGDGGGNDTVVVLITDTILMVDTIFTPGDTVFIPMDTIFVPGETVYVALDTVFLPGDTVFLPLDTVIVYDTLLQYCSRLEASVQEIVWPLRNGQGAYALDFQAALERDRPEQALILSIDERQFEWSFESGLEFRFEGNLSGNAIVRISNIPPPARGHAIDICMTIRIL